MRTSNKDQQKESTPVGGRGDWLGSSFTMTKEQFKKRWKSDDNGGGITFDDIADCAVAWGVAAKPRVMPIDTIRYRVLKAANTDDADEYQPNAQSAPRHE